MTMRTNLTNRIFLLFSWDESYFLRCDDLLLSFFFFSHLTHISISYSCGSHLGSPKMKLVFYIIPSTLWYYFRTCCLFIVLFLDSYHPWLEFSFTRYGGLFLAIIYHIWHHTNSNIVISHFPNIELSTSPTKFSEHKWYHQSLLTIVRFHWRYHK